MAIKRVNATTSTVPGAKPKKLTLRQVWYWNERLGWQFENDNTPPNTSKQFDRIVEDVAIEHQHVRVVTATLE